MIRVVRLSRRWPGLPGALVAAACLLAVPAMADEIADRLDAAGAAYRAGDLSAALAEIEEARRLMLANARPAPAAHLPAAPEGWTRTIDDRMAESLAAMGGGTGAEAVYERDGQRVSLMIVVDSPMATAMAGLFSNADLLATAGELLRVGRQTFLDDGKQVSTVLDGRILVRAKGPDAATILPFLQAIDYRALAASGS